MIWLVLFSVILIPLCALVPFFGNNIWNSQYIGLFFFSFFGISMYLWKFNKYLSLFTIVCLLSTFFGHNGEKFFLFLDSRAILCMTQVYLACLSISVISKFSDKHKLLLLRGIVVLFLLQGVWVTLQVFELDPFLKGIGVYVTEGQKNDTVGLSGSHNQIGLFFAITLPIVLGTIPFLFFVNIFGIFHSTTTAAFIGAMAGAYVFCFYLKNRTIILIALIVAVLSGTIFYEYYENVGGQQVVERVSLIKLAVGSVEKGNLTMRQFKYPQFLSQPYSSKGEGKDKVEIENRKAYKNTMFVRIVKCNPWIGYGLGSFKRLAPFAQSFIDFKQKHRYAHAHNDYAETYFEMGRIGFLALLLIIVDILRRFWRTKKSRMVMITFSSIIAHMVCALGIFTIHTAIPTVILCIMLGIFYAETEKPKAAF